MLPMKYIMSTQKTYLQSTDIWLKMIKKEGPAIKTKTLPVKKIIDDLLILLNPLEYDFTNLFITDNSSNEIIEIQEK